VVALVFVGNDLIVLVKTGSGRMGAFALPTLQELLSNYEGEQAFFSYMLSPTRSV
jgi:ATP-dependent RNA helicase DDX47/RRP3